MGVCPDADADADAFERLNASVYTGLNAQELKVDGLDLWTHLCYEHHFAVLINEENFHERYPPWVGAFWYGQPQEIAQWTPALGCKIVWQKGNAMYINLLNKPFIYKQDSLQNGSTNLLNKPLWQSGPEGDQLELFSSPEMNLVCLPKQIE